MMAQMQDLIKKQEEKNQLELEKTRLEFMAKEKKEVEMFSQE